MKTTQERANVIQFRANGKRLRVLFDRIATLAQTADGLAEDYDADDHAELLAAHVDALQGAISEVDDIVHMPDPEDPRDHRDQER